MYYNFSIVAPNSIKPHICIRDGYWHVSPIIYFWNTQKQWQAAHKFANRKNDEGVLKNCEEYKAACEQIITESEKTLLTKVALF